VQPHGHARRNRIIAIAAGAITVIAIVLGFAGDFLGMPWHWMRPAAELLLLAELVGLVVLERHQLFEPVHEKVSGMEAHIADMRTTLGLLTQQLGAAGQMTVYPNSNELLRAMVRTAHEAFSREQQTPQVFRVARLMGRAYQGTRNDPEFQAAVESWLEAVRGVTVRAGSRADSPTRWWSIRIAMAVGSVETLNLLERELRRNEELKTLNFEWKIFVKTQTEATLSPNLITDRETVLVFDEPNVTYRWGIQFQGRQTSTLFARWFDDLWANIPDSQLVYSRNGLNQTALDLIRKELEAAERVRETA
jgi:hypothetical protein